VKDTEAQDQLFNAIMRIMEDEALQQKLSANIRKLARPNAAEDIANEILKLIK
jgi:UDP-N-acetylglucosamine--N-acetylmuramyl-(pentapeptide) pyrophosphoryl-undecaprenol N-acetylglucosamine transferase